MVDALSLYPTVAINHNISFDTVNCSCCKDDPSARIIITLDKEFLKDLLDLQAKDRCFSKETQGIQSREIKTKGTIRGIWYVSGYNNISYPKKMETGVESTPKYTAETSTHSRVFLI